MPSPLPNLKLLREQAILTQEELAKKTGISRQTINRLEAGVSKARPSTIRKLAVALDISPSELFVRTNV